jgi:hypothetical protein
MRPKAWVGLLWVAIFAETANGALVNWLVPVGPGDAGSTFVLSSSSPNAATWQAMEGFLTNGGVPNFFQFDFDPGFSVTSAFQDFTFANEFEQFEYDALVPPLTNPATDFFGYDLDRLELEVLSYSVSGSPPRTDAEFRFRLYGGSNTLLFQAASSFHPETINTFLNAGFTVFMDVPEPGLFPTATAGLLSFALGAFPIRMRRR